MVEVDGLLTSQAVQVYSEYSEFLVNGGLSLAGLHQTYADGIGDIHRDFATLDLGDDKVSQLHLSQQTLLWGQAPHG